MNPRASLSLAAALLVTACLAPGPLPDETVDPPRRSSIAVASASPLPSPLPSSALDPSLPSRAPSPAALDRWGPLAVVPPQEGADTARTEGRLLITDVCVVLERRGDVALLVWPADRTMWRPEARAITFTNFDGSMATVVDGDLVVLGGSGGSAAENGVPTEQWLARMTWETPPADECVLDEYWSVGAVDAS